MEALSSSLLSARFTALVETSAVEDSALASSWSAENRLEWSRFRNHTLVEVGVATAASSHEEDDEVRPPSLKSWQMAIKFAHAMEAAGAMGVPDRHGPTGVGGLAFEWGSRLMRRVEFFDDGAFECVVFEGDKLTSYELFQP